jgi:hypothetical protein
MTSPLITEWQTLQNNDEQYERNALLIKLTSLSLFLLGQVFNTALLGTMLIVLLCWGLESIIKTYQSRIGQRLLTVEAAIKNGNESEGMQFHTDWQNKRPRGTRLIGEYAKHAVKPTVAFPYAIILFVSVGTFM